MKEYALFLIDLDGTMYRGTEKIEEAPVFIEQLRQNKQDFLFLTNNSTKKPIDVARHLATFGIQVAEELIYTTSMATAQYIQDQKNQAKVYMIGEEGLRSALQSAGCRLIDSEEEISSCDYVVFGLDRQITYEKLALATMAVRSGAQFICTNADRALPTERGLMPGNGSLVSVVTLSTGVQPLVIGKPEALMIHLIMEQKGLRKEELLMIGDNYDTDIQAGIKAGIDTALVFTGFTSKEDLAKESIQPIYCWDHLLEWANGVK